MTNSEKIKMVIEEIKTIYPNKMVLNATQTARIIGISLRTFSRIITNEEWNKLPPFRSEEQKRKDGMKSTKYQFNIFDIAEFLAWIFSKKLKRKKMEDTLLKKPDVIKILKIGRNKLYDIINSGQFISPIRLPNTQIDLYSNNELQEWIRQQKDVRDKNINNQ